MAKICPEEPGQEWTISYNSYFMKKQYLTPDVRVAYVGFEVNVMASPIGFGGVGGEDFDDPDDPFNPWS